MAEESFLQIAQALKAGAPVGQGFADRGAARYNAGAYREQARQTVEAAGADEASHRREARAAIARQVASVSAEGQGDSSAMEKVRENEVNLIRDALLIRGRGERQAAGLSSRAAMAEYEGEQALYSGIQGTGAQLLTTAAEKRARERGLAAASSRRRGY